jgi:hypothetical protein
LASANNAVSADGSRIFWTASSGTYGEGRIYVRINGKNPTIAVSEAGEALSGTGTEDSQYWTAASDGSRAIYSTGNLSSGKADLYEFTVAGKVTKLIAHKVKGVLGASEDASRIYVVSEEALSGANDEGKVPVAGRSNLYFYQAGGAGSFRFIAQLASGDFVPTGGSSGFSPMTPLSNHRTARVSPSGGVTTFMSTAPVTGFDNTDVNSGEADAEVFRYDASAEGGAGRLLCLSCDPTNVAPSGRELAQGPIPLKQWAAARIPSFESPLYASRVLSEDGNRVFFDSYEALVPRDTNEKQDVYEWEAPGADNCTNESPAYSAPNGGCVSLISSGRSSQDSEFVDASPDGRDVFFTTASSLVAQDNGLIDIYDAREGGGFPPPRAPVPLCQGEACQSPSMAPIDTTPASFVFSGPGNLAPPSLVVAKAKTKPRAKPCAKGRVRKKGKCVRKTRRAKKVAGRVGR